MYHYMGSSNTFVNRPNERGDCNEDQASISFDFDFGFCLG